MRQKNGLKNPEGITIDKEGRIYVADEGKDKIFVINKNHYGSIPNLTVKGPEEIIYQNGFFLYSPRRQK